MDAWKLADLACLATTQEQALNKGACTFRLVQLEGYVALTI